MAYALAMKLRNDLHSSSKQSAKKAGASLRPCVMYVGPSQHSVNVVLGEFSSYSCSHCAKESIHVCFNSLCIYIIIIYTDILTTQLPTNARKDLKIIRVFSKGIEKKEFPGPLLNKDLFPQLQTDANCKPHNRPFALHHLVRGKNPRISDMEENFNSLHRQGMIASVNSRIIYSKEISKTEIEILQDGVDIVLCTCNEAASYRILNSVHPVYCIVDECAMATEPECMVPIRRAEHVVLIGDHQQLQPVINYRAAREMGLGESLFERYVSKLGAWPHMLRVQYRMVSIHDY